MIPKKEKKKTHLTNLQMNEYLYLHKNCWDNNEVMGFL